MTAEPVDARAVPGPVGLDAIQARADAASPGPWVRSSEEVILGAVDEFSGLPRWVVALADLIHEADAQFIAAARSDMPALVGEVRRLRGALQAVRDLHRPCSQRPDCSALDARFCCACSLASPCPTVRAVDAVLGGTA